MGHLAPIFEDHWYSSRLLTQGLAVMERNHLILPPVQNESRTGSLFHHLEVIESLLNQKREPPYNVACHCFDRCVGRHEAESRRIEVARQERGWAAAHRATKHYDVLFLQSTLLQHILIDVLCVLLYLRCGCISIASVEAIPRVLHAEHIYIAMAAYQRYLLLCYCQVLCVAVEIKHQLG